MFTALAVPGVAAIIHGRVINVIAGARKAPVALGWIIATAALNAAGAVVYATKVSLCRPITIYTICVVPVDITLMRSSVSGEIS